MESKLTLEELGKAIEALKYATRRNVTIEQFISSSNGYYIKVDQPYDIVCVFVTPETIDFVNESLCVWFFEGKEKELEFARLYGMNI